MDISKQDVEKIFVLTKQDIGLNLQAKNKNDAIQQIADFLIQNGRVSLEYKEGMIAREREVSTYLMNGVAIPHGVNESKKYIKNSGIFIGQFPDGVIWNEKNDVVYIVCGLASNSDAHLDVLARLTTIVMEESLVKQLAETKGVNEFLKIFSGEENVKSQLEESKIEGKSKTILFTGENGMHARPATFIAEYAQAYPDTEIKIHAKGKSCTAKSMPAILTLNISPQTEITVSAKGINEDEALSKIVSYIEETVNHEKLASVEEDAENIYDPIKLEEDSKYIAGIKASAGMAVGRVFKLELDEFNLVEKAGKKEEEIKLLHNALHIAKEQLLDLKEEMKTQNLDKEAEIVDSHIMIFRDELILQKIEEQINAGYSAPYSVNKAFDTQIILLEQLEDSVLRARSYDMKDVKVRLLRILENKNETQSLPVSEPFILVSKELTPTQTATLNKHPVLGICTVLGGETSHMAILARALGIPAIVGMGEDLLQVSEEQEVILDAQSGRLIINPSKELIVKAQKISNEHRLHHAKEEKEAQMEAITEDGIKIDVLCNIANAEDATLVSQKGGEGVGLFRTEFLFENNIEKPSVDEQYRCMVKVASALGNLPIIVRVMDIGGDKPVSWLKMPHEDNPFLGIRGIRLLLRNPQVFEEQLSAIYKAALWQKEQGRQITFHIMFPMIARTSEFLRAKKIALKVRDEVQAPDIPLGIMIETPAAALISEHIAKEVDFFSIGTNDLTQYTLAMDRVHPELSKDADSLHPSVLRLINMTVKGAVAYKKQVGVCGNMAADPVMLTALIAFGIRDVSVSPANVATAKYLIRRLNTKELESLNEQIMNSGSGTEVRKICETYFKDHLVKKL